MVRNNNILTALAALGGAASAADIVVDNPFTVFITGQANATSKVQQIPGYDNHLPYPGKPIDGWTVSWSVAHRPINESASWTSSGFQISPPESNSKLDGHDTWGTCGTHVFIDGSKDLKDVDSLCKGIISDSCQKALLDGVKKSQICFGKDEFPKECAKEFANHQTERLDFRGEYATVGFSYEAEHAPDNFTLYDSLLNKVVLTFLGYKPNPDEPVQGDDAKGPLLEGFLSCLKADNIKEGSRTLKDENKGSNTEGASGTVTTPPPAGAASALQSGSIGVAALVALVAAIM
jgi:hypothetical protein